jgi:hypothetical protein
LGREAQFNFRGRRSLTQSQLHLRLVQVSDWPPRLRKTYEVLTNELSLPRETATGLIVQSLQPALKCLQAQNQLLNRNEKTETHGRLQRICFRVSKGIKRGPAALRTRLEQELGPLVHAPIIDLEIIEAIFEKTAAAFEEWSKDEITAATRALREWRTSLSAALTAEARAAAEKSLVDLAANAPTGGPTAMEVFGALGEALKHTKELDRSTQIRSFIVDYVAEIAELWRQVGLRPGRAYSESDPTYFSRFHWFADDILATIAGSSEERGEIPTLVSHHDLRAGPRPNGDDDGT